MKKQALSQAQMLLNINPKRPKELIKEDLPVSRDGSAKTPADLLSLEGVHIVDCQRLWPELADIDTKLHSQLETDYRYSGYLARQQSDIEAMRRDDALRIPSQISFRRLAGYLLKPVICSNVISLRLLVRPAVFWHDASSSCSAASKKL